MQIKIIKQNVWNLVTTGILIILLTQPQGVQAMGSISLEIDGSEGVTYVAHWVVETGDETREYHDESDQIPTQFFYSGEAISGTVTLLSEGQLTLTVEKNGNHSRSATQGKGSTLQFSVR